MTTSVRPADLALLETSVPPPVSGLRLTWLNSSFGRPLFAPIAVGEGAWIGAGAIVLGGVRIGHGCVVGAGAVVTRDCAPNGLYVGVPASRQRDLPDC
jgi:maltose O-acetyltransferase